MKKFLSVIAILFSLTSFSQLAPIEPGVAKSSDYHFFVWQSPYELGADVDFEIISEDGDVIPATIFQSAYVDGKVYYACIYYVKGNPKYKNYLIRTNYNGSSSEWVEVETVRGKK